MKKRKSKSKPDLHEALEINTNTYKYVLDLFQNEFPEQFKSVTKIANETIDIMERNAENFEIAGISERIYWMMLAVHVGYATEGMSNRLMKELLKSGIEVVDGEIEISLSPS